MFTQVRVPACSFNARKFDTAATLSGWRQCSVASRLLAHNSPWLPTARGDANHQGEEPAARMREARSRSADRRSISVRALPKERGMNLAFGLAE